MIFFPQGFPSSQQKAGTSEGFDNNIFPILLPPSLPFSLDIFRVHGMSARGLVAGYENAWTG
jgi:hypothetical protein